MKTAVVYMLLKFYLVNCMDKDKKSVIKRKTCEDQDGSEGFKEKKSNNDLVNYTQTNDDKDDPYYFLGFSECKEKLQHDGAKVLRFMVHELTFILKKKEKEEICMSSEKKNVMKRSENKLASLTLEERNKVESIFLSWTRSSKLSDLPDTQTNGRSNVYNVHYNIIGGLKLMKLCAESFKGIWYIKATHDRKVKEQFDKDEMNKTPEHEQDIKENNTENEIQKFADKCLSGKEIATTYFSKLAHEIKTRSGSDDEIILDRRFRWWVIGKIFAALECFLVQPFGTIAKCVQLGPPKYFHFIIGALDFDPEKVDPLKNTDINVDTIVSTCFLSSKMFGEEYTKTDFPDNIFLGLLKLLKEASVKHFRYISCIKYDQFQNHQYFYNSYKAIGADEGYTLLMAEHANNTYFPTTDEFKDMLMVKFANLVNIKKYTLVFKCLEIERLKLLKNWLLSVDADTTKLLTESTFVLRIRESTEEKDFSVETYKAFTALLEEVLGNNIIFPEFPLRYAKFPPDQEHLNGIEKASYTIMKKYIPGSKPVGFFDEMTLSDCLEENKSVTFIDEDIRKYLLARLEVDLQPIKFTFILPFNQLLYDKIREELNIKECPINIAGKKTSLPSSKHAGRLDGEIERKELADRKINKGAEGAEEKEIDRYAIKVQEWINGGNGSFNEFLNFLKDLKFKLPSTDLRVWVDVDEDVANAKRKIVINMSNKKTYFLQHRLSMEYKRKLWYFFTGY